ncbi:MAG TPA: lipopolysaccharide assembly protein LapA domain-containing protein [Rhodothermales bacterium]|nr:lipopolysaccharide assembly protein LapA domain-containing protein [Rhodothermales bacterium]
MRIAVVVSLIIATLAIVFAVINPLSVNINFGFFTIHGAPLPLLLISTLLLGVLIGYLAWLPGRITMRRKLRSSERSRSESTVELVSDQDEATLAKPKDFEESQ